MVRLVIEDHEVVDVADDHTEIDARIRRLGHWLFAKEVVGRVDVVEGWVDPALVDAMYIGQEQIAAVRHKTDLVLDMDRQLEITVPILSLITVRRKQRIVT